MEDRLLTPDFSRPALGDTFTTPSPLGKAQPIKASISGPIRSETASNVAETLSGPATSGITTYSIPAFKTSMADADDLQRKITTLMVQAAIQEEDTNKKSKVYATLSTKISPFQRGKEVFVKATRAIKDRLSNHSHETLPKAAAYSSDHVDPNYESETSSMYEHEESDSRTRLNRRIAEGQNLANPKIQALVGDRNVARKPLPVYESMKSRSQRSGSFDDPFSDGDDAMPSPSLESDTGFNINFRKPTHKRSLAKDPVATYEQIHSILAISQPDPLTSRPTPRYLVATSGLTQHPGVMDFSSSPIGYSTPRVRLEPQPATRDKGKGRTLPRAPSILDFSFEGKSDDDQSLVHTPNSKAVTDGSQSVKRKSAQSDLRSPVLFANKKPKTVSPSAGKGRTAENGMMEGEDERFPLSSLDRNAVLGPAARLASKGRGLKMFELGKEKAPETGLDRKNQKGRPRPIFDRRSSLPRTGRTLFNGRDPRPGLKRLTSIGADSMDIDELHTNDAAYQVGNTKK